MIVQTTLDEKSRLLAIRLINKKMDAGLRFDGFI